MYCVSCGSKLEEGTKFCEVCGMPVKSAFEDPGRSGQSGYGNERYTYDPYAQTPTPAPRREYRETVSAGIQNAARQARKTAGAVAGNVGTAVNGLQLSRDQMTAVILAACAVLFCLLGINFRSFRSFTYTIISLAGSGLLLWVCLKKHDLPSALTAAAITVYALRFLMIDAQRILGVIYYDITFFTVINRLAIYALAVLCWLIAVDKNRISPVIDRVIIGISAYLALYELIQLRLNSTFSGWMFSLGKIAFLACAAWLAIMLDRKISAAAGNSTPRNTGAAAYTAAGPRPGSQFCTNCGAQLPADASFCDVCGTRLGGGSGPDRSIPYQKDETENAYKTSAPVPAGDEAPLSDPVNVPDSVQKANGDGTGHPEELLTRETTEPVPDGISETDRKPVCHNCGREISADALFCDFCGAPQSNDTAAEAMNDTVPEHTYATGFMGLPEYVIDEKISPFRFANAYRVYDSLGNEVGAVQQVNISGGAKAARLLLGNSAKGMQAFQFNILDNDGSIIASIKRGGIGGGAAALRNISILDGYESVIGYINLIPGWKPKMNVTDENGNQLCGIAGDWKGWNFAITAPDGSQIGEINKKWSGVGRELFTNADKYRVVLHGSHGDTEKRIITAAAITIDMVMHELA